MKKTIKKNINNSNDIHQHHQPNKRQHFEHQEQTNALDEKNMKRRRQQLTSGAKRDLTQAPCLEVRGALD
jgi:hypothetical protein